MKHEQKIEAAVERARRHLLRLNVHSFNEPAVDRRREHQAAIAALETILSETRGLLSAIEQVLKTIIPALKQARPAKGEWGRSSKLSSSRNQLIRETAVAIRNEQKLTWDQTYAAVAKALARMEITLSEKSIKDICESRGKRPPSKSLTLD
jgi:hypothetical protein